MIQDHNYPFVSVVIPALNEESYIYRSLSSITEVNYPDDKYEIILVDNGSTDRTVHIAKKFRIQLHPKTEGTIGSLRNFGAKRAKGEILAFTDADCQVDKDWLRNAVLHFSDSSVAAAGCRLKHDASTWVAKSWSLIHSEKVEIGETNWIPSGNMLIRKKYFWEVGGFDEQLTTSEDYELCLKLKLRGYKVLSDPKIAATHLDPPRTLSEFFRKELWHGRNMLRTLSYNPLRISRALVYAVFFLFGLIGLLLGTAVFSVSRDFSILFFFVLILLCSAFCLALRTAWHNRSYSDLVHLTLIYIVYGFARSLCLLISIFKKT